MERSTPSQYGPVVRNGLRQTNAHLPRARGSGVGMTSEGTDRHSGRNDVSDLVCIDTTYSIEGVNEGCAGWRRLFTQMGDP